MSAVDDPSFNCYKCGKPVYYKPLSLFDSTSGQLFDDVQRTIRHKHSKTNKSGEMK